MANSKTVVKTGKKVVGISRRVSPSTKTPTSVHKVFGLKGNPSLNKTVGTNR